MKLPIEIYDTCREAVNSKRIEIERSAQHPANAAFKPIWDEALGRYNKTILWLQENEEELTK